MTTVDPTPGPTGFVFVGVDAKEVGDIDIEFEGGETYAGKALVLSMLVLNLETADKETILFIVPKSQGFALVGALLTPEQLDAVLDAETGP